MKEYFTGHRDAVRINEFLNGHSEDSRRDCASIIHHSSSLCHQALCRGCGTSYSTFGRQDEVIR